MTFHRLPSPSQVRQLFRHLRPQAGALPEYHVPRPHVWRAAPLERGGLVRGQPLAPRVPQPMGRARYPSRWPQTLRPSHAMAWSRLLSERPHARVPGAKGDTRAANSAFCFCERHGLQPAPPRCLPAAANPPRCSLLLEGPRSNPVSDRRFVRRGLPFRKPHHHRRLAVRGPRRAAAPLH